MDEPPVAEALLIEDGDRGRGRHPGRGAGRSPVTTSRSWTSGRTSRTRASSTPTPTGSAIAASTAWDRRRKPWMRRITRGWTSISEQWVNPERLDELTTLAADDALPLRVDAYLALNEPAPSGAHLGDWYTDREPGPVGDRLRVQGVKITLDNGWGTIFHWEPGRAHRDDRPGERCRLAGLGPHRQHRGPRDGARRVRGGHRPDRSEPAPPSDRPRHPGDGRPARPDGRDGPGHGHPPRRGCGRLGARGGLPGPPRPRQPRRNRSAGSPDGATSWTPVCTSPQPPTRHGSSRASP